jgi:hypothetical protein
VPMFKRFDVRLRRRAVNLQLVVDSSITGAVAAARNLQLRSAFLAIGPAEFPFSPFDLGKLFLHSMKKTVAGSRRRVSLFRHVRTPSFFPGAPSYPTAGTRERFTSAKIRRAKQLGHPG